MQEARGLPQQRTALEQVHGARPPASEAARRRPGILPLDTVPQLNLRRVHAPYETVTRGAPRLIPP